MWAYCFFSIYCGKKYLRDSQTPKSENAERRVIRLIIPYKIPSSDTETSHDIRILTTYQMGAII